MYRYINVANYLGNLKQQEKLKMCINDLKLANNLRGWIKQEINSIEKKSKNKNNRIKTRINIPPGYELTHQRGREKIKGFGYEHSNLIYKIDNKLQNKFTKKYKFNKNRHFDKILYK